MNIQRLRNLTTGLLHTEIGHIYEDLGEIIGEQVLMTHMLPRAMTAVEPWLREHVKDPRFWDGEYDTTHTGNIEIPVPTEADRAEMFERYLESAPIHAAARSIRSPAPPFHDRIVGDETCPTLLALEIETDRLFRPRPTRRTPA